MALRLKLLILTLITPLLLLASPQGVPVHTNTVIGTSSTQLLARNNNRGYILVQNNGSGNCQFKFGTAITSDNDGVVIGAGQNYEAINSYIKAPVFMKCASSASVAAIEGNY